MKVGADDGACNGDTDEGFNGAVCVFLRWVLVEVEGVDAGRRAFLQQATDAPSRE